MKEITMTLTKAKVTKGTVRYDYDGPREAVPIPAVYIRKLYLTSPYPETIELTLGQPDNGEPV